MATYPMSQGDLYLVLPLAWQQYADNQPAFAGYKKIKYTAALGTEALTRLAAAMALPDDQARGAMPESTRVELAQQTQEFLDVWNLLDGYLEEAYKPTDNYKAMREAAGSKRYAAAANDDWGAAQELVETVRGTRQAGIRGVATDANGQDVAGATVAVKGVEGASAVTDADGRYFIGLASGTYTVVVTGVKESAGVVVDVGVKKRVDVGV